MSDHNQQHQQDTTMQQEMQRALFGEAHEQPSSEPDEAERIARAFFFPQQQRDNDEQRTNNNDEGT